MWTTMMQARRKASGTEGFVIRLNQACDDAANAIPPHGEGRQIVLARLMGMSQEGVRKWFAGEAMPRREAMRRLAQILGVEEPWLALGITPEITSAERRIHAHKAEGATLLAMGLMMIAGGQCAQPGPDDPRSDYVDFYAILHGVQFAMRVNYAREVSRGRFDIIIPRQFAEVRNLAFVNLGKGRFEFVDMPTRVIDEHKSRKSGDYLISVNRIENKYVTGSYVWKRIRDFGELA